MANVFVSYAREDLVSAMLVVEALAEAGHSAWRDDRLIASDKWDQEIERQLRKADAVIVLWSSHAVRSEWVKLEAAFAKEHNKLAAALIEPCDLPLAFRFHHAVDLEFWDGDPEDGEFGKLLEGVSGIAKKANALEPPPPGYNFIQECNSTDWRIAGNTIVRIFDYRGSLNPIRLGMEFVVERSEMIARLTGVPGPALLMLFMFTSERFDVSKPLHLLMRTESGDRASAEIPLRAHLREDGHIQIGRISADGVKTIFDWLNEPQDVVMSIRNRDEPVLVLPIPHIEGLRAAFDSAWRTVRS